MGAMKMGKNLKATMCKKCWEGVCYYGAKICSDCQLRQAEEERLGEEE